MSYPSYGNGGNNLGRLAAGAAIGFFAGLAVPHARKAVMQAPSVLAGDWVEALMAEHRLVEGLFDKLLKTDESQVVKREMLLTKIAYALSKHAIEEENVVYPALMEGARSETAKHLTEDHAKIKTFIYDLRRISSSDPQWIGVAREFFDELQHHVREEEDEIFPQFRNNLSPEDNARITKMMNWEGFKVA
ncbi:MAG TPA: hemerythrin domain-containing protein [Phenylobacterium sp.]